MRKRNIKINVYVNEEEKKILEVKSNKARLSQSDFIRNLINNYKDDKIDINQIISALLENINCLIKVKNKFHYLGYYQDEEAIQFKIDYLKNLNNNISKKF